MTTNIASKTVRDNKYPLTQVSNAIGCVLLGTNYVYSTDADRYSISPTLSVTGAKHVTSGLAVDAKAICTNQAGMSSKMDRSFDRYLTWKDIEISAGVYNWTALDAWVAASFAAGKEMIYTLFGTPLFYTSTSAANPNPDMDFYGVGSTTFPDQAAGGVAGTVALGNFITALVNRYKSTTPIQYLEIWNEPKYAGGGGSNYFIGTPTQLAQIARFAVTAAKAADPTILALSTCPTGLEYAWVSGAVDGSGSDYLNRFLSASDGAGFTGAKWVDIVSVHTYSHSGYNDLFSLPQIVKNIKSVLTANGMPTTTPIWSTECGAISPALTLLSIQDQKKFIARSLVMHVASSISRVVWYGAGTLAPTDATVKAYWDYMAGLLNGATLGSVNYQLSGTNGAGAVDYGEVQYMGLTLGTVWATINGTKYEF